MNAHEEHDRDANAPLARPLAPSLAQALERLRASGLKVTSARTAILSVLLAEHGPFTIEAIHEAVGAGECDLVTVYRNLRSLEDAGMIQRCEFGDGVSRFEFNHPDEHHHHVVCRICHRIEYLSLCPLDFLDKHVTQMGYSDVGHLVSFHGICEACRSHRRAP